IGGALGGLFNGLLAPVIFNDVYEYPLVIAASVFLLVGLRHREHPPSPAPLPQRLFEAINIALLPLVLLLAIGAMGPIAVVVVVGLLLGARRVVAFVAARRPVAFVIGMSLVLATTIPFTGDALETERTFFGVARVEAEGDRHVLVHGTTIHGWQDRRPDHLLVPQSYYERSGPIGDVFAAYGAQPLADEVGLIGLGTGGLAAYGRAGQRLVFYEIDEAIVDIATDPGLFSFVSDTPAEVEIVVGDGRLALGDAPADRYGMIIIDAFSSDAIPVHLLTSEAFELYRSKLAPGGLIVVHISNRHLDLKAVVAGIAQRQGLTAAVRTALLDPALGSVTWAVLAETSDTLAPLTSNPTWQPPAVEPGRELLWTDDFSDIVRVIKCC
ncbi:MAG: fused MFS/spermidine synthase, partial [Actinomycetota bacterium]|nr:fused MFS/spermidine synthase [Actinomycetota bacterium]